MDKNYIPPKPALWSGRSSGEQQYMHEKVICHNLRESGFASLPAGDKRFALLGYACDEGIKRNLGRPGAVQGPDAFREAFGKMANHLPKDAHLADCGNIRCVGTDLKKAHQVLADQVTAALRDKVFPVLVGGGHDISYAHHTGLQQYLQKQDPTKTVGIINLDAHFDLRTFTGQANSGTPFYQIAQTYPAGKFNYLCLGIQPQSNIPTLFETAKQLRVKYITHDQFTLAHLAKVLRTLQTFIVKVDVVYLTIDLDGFTSALAPGVSAPSAAGFTYDVVREVLTHITGSGKLISFDVAELNPAHDIDQHTARLAASLVTTLITQIAAV